MRICTRIVFKIILNFFPNFIKSIGIEIIISIKDIPYTINGKKVELAVKIIIQDIEVKNRDSLVNPEVLNYYKELSELH